MTADLIALKPCPNPWCHTRTVPVPAQGLSGWRIYCGCGVRTFSQPTEAEARAVWNGVSSADALEARPPAIEARAEPGVVEALTRLRKVVANYIRCSTASGTLSPYIPENGLYSYKSPWAELREEAALTTFDTSAETEGRGVAGTREAVARTAATAWYDGAVAWEIQDKFWKAAWFRVADALSALAQQPGEEGWRPMSEVPTDGKPIKVRVVTTYKWTPYKPDGQRQMKAKGRWQTLRSEYGGWINADLPEEGQWMPYPGRSAPPPALAGAEQLQASTAEDGGDSGKGRG